MKKTVITFLGVIMACLVFAGGNDGKHTLTVVIKNVKSSDGQITVSLFDNAGDWLEKGKVSSTDINDPTTVTLTFEDIPSGTYAASAIHDENGNDELDTGTFGIPEEPYGFSNDARGMFGPASFDDSQFEVKANTTIEITIK